MKKARIAILGVGWWGTVGHLAPLAEDDGTEVVAVWSRTEEKVRRRAEEYGVARAYTDWRALLQECELDGVIIASTPNMHYPQARYALERGLHTLVEKPFVVDAEHALDLGRIADQRGLMLSVCHPMLYHEPLQEVRRSIQRGDLGPIRLVSAHFSQRTYELLRGAAPTYSHPRQRGDQRVGPNPSSYSDPDVAGGGEGHAQASHIVGALLWLTGLRPATVCAMMEDLQADVDVIDAMTVRFVDGALGTITANGSVVSGPMLSEIMVQGPEGTMFLSARDHPRPASGVESEGVLSHALPTRQEYRAVMARVPINFCRAIVGAEELLVPGRVAVDEACLLSAAYESVATGGPVRVASA